MKKRFARLAALMLALALLAGCSGKHATQTARTDSDGTQSDGGSAATDEETLLRALRETLIPQYGVSTEADAIKVPYEHTYTDDGHPYFSKPAPDTVNGLLAAALTDLDGNGRPELLTARLQRSGTGRDLIVELHTRGANGAVETAGIRTVRFFSEHLLEYAELMLLQRDGKQYLLLKYILPGDGGYSLSTTYACFVYGLTDGAPECVCKAGWNWNRYGIGDLYVNDVKGPTYDVALMPDELAEYQPILEQELLRWGITVNLRGDTADAFAADGTRLLTFAFDRERGDDPCVLLTVSDGTSLLSYPS